MIYGYREIKKVSAEALRNLCVENDWYTKGTNEEYDLLLDYGFSHKELSTDDLVEMATLIMEYSDIYDYRCEDIMFEINKICNVYYVEC